MTLRSLLIVLALAACLGACASSSTAPGDINAGFKDPDADPQRWVDRFEGESREIFAHREAIAEAVALEDGERVADIGAGTGLFLPIFSEAVGETGKVYAVDISPRLVDYMRERVAETGLTNVRVMKSNEKSATLDAGSVDVVFTCDTYHHFTYYPEMLASIHQALDDGGRLVLIDFERIPGVTREWLLDHVRAGKEQVISEVEAAGFEFVDEAEVPGLEENYLIRFVKR